MVAGICPVVDRKDTPDRILIQFELECQIDLLSNAGTTVSWIAWYGIPAFHLDNGSDDFSGWSFWTWLAPAAG